jgi:ABC-type antimicrobial peptide transport system permease subunit
MNMFITGLGAVFFGLVIGFLVYFAIGLGLYGKQELQLWQTPPAAAPITQPGATPQDIEIGG